MGAELGQWNEWHYEYSLDWHLLQYEPHRQLQAFFQEANRLYLAQPALWEQDDSWKGFQWLCADDNQGNTVAFLRLDAEGKPLVVVCNFSPVHRDGYRVGVPFPGAYAQVFNTEWERFGGSGIGNAEPVKSEYLPCHDQEQSIAIDLPPMSAVVFRCARRYPPRRTADKADKAPALKPATSKKDASAKPGKKSKKK